MHAVLQVRCGRERPRAVCGDRGRAKQLRTVINLDDVARVSRAGNDRLRTVGRAAAYCRANGLDNRLGRIDCLCHVITFYYIKSKDAEPRETLIRIALAAPVKTSRIVKQ